MTYDSTKYPLRSEITVLPADTLGGRRLGFAMYEDIGIGMVNPRGAMRSSMVSAAPCPDCGDIPSEESAGWCRSCEALLVLRA